MYVYFAPSRSVNNVFSVKYFLNLVLVDEDDRRYFKQQEVIFWRRPEEDTNTSPAANNNSSPARAVRRFEEKDLGTV